MLPSLKLSHTLSCWFLPSGYMCVVVCIVSPAIAISATLPPTSTKTNNHNVVAVNWLI